MGGFATAASELEGAIQTDVAAASASIAVWLLAAVFAVGGMAKLRRPAHAAIAMVDFGVVGQVRPALGRILGFAELVLAVALVVAPRPSVPVAATLLWGFAILIARSLVLGARFPCFCFGDSDVPISASTLARTTGLAVLATVIIFGTMPLLRPLNVTGLLEAVSAVALLAGVVLAGQLRRLLRWNRNPFGERMIAP